MAATYEATLVAVAPAAAGPPTFTEMCALKWEKLKLLEELGGAGMCTVDVQIDSIEPVGKARLIRLDLFPLELWIRRSTSFSATSLVFAGPVTGCQIIDRTLTVAAPGLLTYLAYWLRDTAYSAGAAGLDQATIAQQLCDQWQAQAYGNDGIITTLLTATGVIRTLELAATDGKYILPVITEMGGRNNGFDLAVDPATRALRMWSPRKGNDLTGSVILDRRSIGVPHLSWSVAPGSIGSEAFASSYSTTGVTLTSIASNAALRATFGRSYVSRAYSDVSVQGTLDDYAQRATVDAGTQVFTIAPELVPVTGFGYGDFFAGDVITWDYDAGLGQQTFPVRVASIETTLDTGREMLKVGFL